MNLISSFFDLIISSLIFLWSWFWRELIVLLVFFVSNRRFEAVEKLFLIMCACHVPIVFAIAAIVANDVSIQTIWLSPVQWILGSATLIFGWVMLSYGYCAIASLIDYLHSPAPTAIPEPVLSVEQIYRADQAKTVQAA